MLLKLDDEKWFYTKEEIKQFEADFPECKGELEAFQLKDVKYSDGVYGYIDEYYLREKLNLIIYDFDNKLYKIKKLSEQMDYYHKKANLYGLNNTDTFYEYGVCDGLDNLLETYPELVTNKETYVISLNILKKEWETTQNWRWHKNGTYIGNQNPQYEYLFDEPEIEVIYTYHIYKICPYI